MSRRTDRHRLDVAKKPDFHEKTNGGGIEVAITLNQENPAYGNETDRALCGVVAIYIECTREGWRQAAWREFPKEPKHGVMHEGTISKLSIVLRMEGEKGLPQGADGAVEVDVATE